MTSATASDASLKGFLLGLQINRINATINMINDLTERSRSIPHLFFWLCMCKVKLITAIVVIVEFALIRPIEQFLKPLVSQLLAIH